MKTRKMILGITAALLVFAVTFIACKKHSDESVAGQQNPASTANTVTGTIHTSGARSSGSQSYYSASEDGTTFYKMDLTWASDGSVIVDRNEVTSYPAGTETGWTFGDDTPYTVFDADSTDSDVDSVFVAMESGKKYYIISFTPGVPPIASEHTNPGPSGYALSCSCLSGGKCKMSTNSGGYFTCNKVTCNVCLLSVINRYNDEEVIREVSKTIGNSGAVFIEAEDISMTN